MNPADTLGALIDALDAALIPYMLAGSFASSLHGLARSTADIDVVIDPPPGGVEQFVAALETDRFYVPLEGARRAAETRDQFNVIDKHTGWKIDLIVRKDRPFSVAEFDRRIPATVLGVSVFVASAEDTVLSKLEWSLTTGSERQARDVADVLRIRRSDIDDAYLDRWAGDLGVVRLLANARERAGTGGSGPE